MTSGSQYWRYVVWGPQGNAPEVSRVQNPAARLEYMKGKMAATHFFEIPADAIPAAAGEA